MNDEEWAEKTIKSMRTCANFPEAFDFFKFKKLKAMATKNEKIQKLLIKELETASPATRNYIMFVAHMLVQIEAHDALPAMSRILLNKDFSEGARWHSGSTMGMFGKPALRYLTVASKSDETFVRHCAALSLGNLIESKEPGAIPLLLQLMQDEDRNVRETAIGALYDSPPEFAGPDLLKALQSKNPMFRAGAADVLIDIKVSRRNAEKALLELLGHADVEVRVQALRGLQHKGGRYSKAAVLPLRVALKDKDQRVCTGAAYALGILGPKAEPAVIDLIEILN